MARDKSESHEIVLNAAKREFLEKGFEVEKGGKTWKM